MQQARTVRTISYAAAARLVREAVAHAGDAGWRVAVAVVDPWGAPVATGRMDGTPAPVADFANDKAFTAGTLGESTQSYFAAMDGNPQQAAGSVGRSRLCAWPGGIAIYDGDTLLGGIGVSGAAGPDDIACAEHAVKVLGLNPR